MADNLINSGKMLDSFGTNLTRLDKAREKAGSLVSIGPFSVPNQFLGLDLRTEGQKTAQKEPEAFRSAMHDLLAAIEKANEKIHDVVLLKDS